MFSIIMSKNIVVTNLRVEKNLWLQIKSIAAADGLSVNEYLNRLIRYTSLKSELIPEEAPIWKLSEIAKNIKLEPLGELSEDDKIIYEE